MISRLDLFLKKNIKIAQLEVFPNSLYYAVQIAWSTNSKETMNAKC